jgi:hypothetical protein
MNKSIKFMALTSVFAATNLFAEDLHFSCIPHRENERPYRTFEVSILNADTNNSQSEVSFQKFPSKNDPNADAAGIVDGFDADEVYSTQITSHYRMIRISGGKYLSGGRRDVLQLQKRHGTQYKGSYEFPEGSDQLDLAWGSTLVLDCERTL